MPIRGTFGPSAGQKWHSIQSKPAGMKASKRAQPYPAPLDGLVYPRFSGIPTFMRLPHVTQPEKLDVALVGVPFDGGTSYRPGPRFGPRNIRVQSAMIRPYNPVLKINPFEKLRIADFGDLPVNPLSIERTYRLIQSGLKPLVDGGVIPICVGGDHSILLATLRAVHARHGPVALVQLDSHSDTWDQYWGSKYSHGTPVRRAIEEGLLRQGYILQVGLRGQLYGEDDLAYAREHKLQMVTTEELLAKGPAPIRRLLNRFRGQPTYLSLDIDVVDPAFAPGTGTPQVGGLSSAQILEVMRVLQGLKFIAGDLVEVSPPYDSAEITSLLAANLLFEMLCLLAF
jgi:agmatinase